MSSRVINPSTPERLDSGFFERLFEGAGLAIFACDAQGTIVAWNALGERLWGERGGCRVAGDVRDILPGPDRPVFEASLQALLRSGEPLEFRTRFETAPGETHEFAVWLAPLPSPEGAAEGVSVWFHDITDRMNVRRSTRKSERLNTLGAMSGSVAHHYSNLLCSIATSLEYAMNMNTMTAMRRALQRTADAVSRATQLTQQLLAFAQADYRTCDVADLTELVLYYFDQNESRLNDQGVRLELDWQPIPSLAIPREQFLLVLGNLCDNAVEAMPGGGTITIGLRPIDAGRVGVSVRDTGPGIAPEHMDRLFEPFFTTKGALSAGSSRQAGMGLAVAHGLVSEMHGTISAANDAAGGARFDIVLPIPSGDNPR